jgi:hypothetical protein
MLFEYIKFLFYKRNKEKTSKISNDAGITSKKQLNTFKPYECKLPSPRNIKQSIAHYRFY